MSFRDSKVQGNKPYFPTAFIDARAKIQASKLYNRTLEKAASSKSSIIRDIASFIKEKVIGDRKMQQAQAPSNKATSSSLIMQEWNNAKLEVAEEMKALGNNPNKTILHGKIEGNRGNPFKQLIYMMHKYQGTPEVTLKNIIETLMQTYTKGDEDDSCLQDMQTLWKSLQQAPQESSTTKSSALADTPPTSTKETKSSEQVRSAFNWSSNEATMGNWEHTYEVAVDILSRSDQMTGPGRGKPLLEAGDYRFSQVIHSFKGQDLLKLALYIARYNYLASKGNSESIKMIDEPIKFLQDKLGITENSDIWKDIQAKQLPTK